jgi:hypothetical protein
LESQQPYKELQAVVRQKEAVQAENEEIRRRLASIMSIIQPIVGAQGLTGKHIVSSAETAADTMCHQDLATAAQHNVQAGLVQPSNDYPDNSMTPTDPYLNGQPNPQSYTSPESTSYPTLSAAEPGANQWTTSRDALVHQRNNLHKALELNESGERLNFNFLLDGLHQQQQQEMQVRNRGQQTPVRTPNHSANLNSATTWNSPPLWRCLPNNIEPTCPLDTLLLNFTRSRQQQNSDDPSSNLGHPAYPSVSSLLNPSAGVHRHLDPLSQLMTDIISKFENICGIPEQAGILFLMFMTMRWQTHVTQENYKRLPEWLRPTAAQRNTPHPAWIDHIPWPQMRDRIVATYPQLPFENWFVPFTTGLSINWPYDPYDCFLSTADIEDPPMNPVFERHIRRLENWSLGPEFAVAFPELATAVRIRGSHRSSSKSRSLSSN